MSLIDRIRRLFQKDKPSPGNAASHIDSLATYRQCFDPEAPIFLLGNGFEVSFDKTFFPLVKGERFFRLEYRYNQSGQSRLIAVHLPDDNQRVRFLRKQLFEDQGVLPADLQLLQDREGLSPNGPFSDFKLYIQDEAKGVKEVEQTFRGILLPDDELLKRTIAPRLEELNAIIAELSGDFLRNTGNGTDATGALTQAFRHLVFQDQGEENFHAMTDSFKQVLVEEIGFVFLEELKAYSFEDNVRDWMVQHMGLRT